MHQHQYQFTTKSTQCISYHLTFILYIFSDIQLMSFFKSMDTCFARLTYYNKSGHAAVESTERDKFVLTLFSFQKSHIRRCPSRSNTKVVGLLCF